MFVLAVFLFHESFVMVQVVTFILIWTALAIYSIDSVRYYKRADQFPAKNGAGQRD
jgi:chloramphenicol-sensitive protein RarD